MTNTTQENWREEFREKCVYSLRMDGNQTIQLTDFISNLLSSQLKSLVEEIEGLKDRHKCDEMCEFECKDRDVENNVIEDIQAIINKRMLKQYDNEIRK